MGMRRLVYALAGISIAVLAADAALAGTTSNRLTVTVTVVAPGTLGGTDLPPGTSGVPSDVPGDASGQPAAPPPDRPEASSPLPDTATPPR